MVPFQLFTETRLVLVDGVVRRADRDIRGAEARLGGRLLSVGVVSGSARRPNDLGVTSK